VLLVLISQGTKGLGNIELDPHPPVQEAATGRRVPHALELGALGLTYIVLCLSLCVTEQGCNHVNDSAVHDLRG
jgi:hypothetical protein